MEFLEFIFQGFWHWAGFVLGILIICAGVAMLIDEVRG